MTTTISGQELEHEVQRVMHEVILSLLGESPINLDSVTPPGQKLACRVAIHGGFEGQVVVNATFGIAAEIATQMFGEDLSGPPTSHDAQEALREVTNIVAGNLKPLFGEQNSLGLPEDVPGGAEVSNGGQLAEATAMHSSGLLQVRVYAAL
ncbi:MAG: chemotaxis protein CheX [Polyangiales bacterium]